VFKAFAASCSSVAGASFQGARPLVMRACSSETADAAPADSSSAHGLALSGLVSAGCVKQQCSHVLD
jgi:hypothetical protein